MSIIKTLIFDFGDVFINLDKQGAMQKACHHFELKKLPEEVISINILFEQGLITTEEFLTFYTDNFPNLSKTKIIEIWNSILKDFPAYRLEFIKKLATEKKHQLILLSNTNALHIDCIKNNVAFFEEFKACFDQFYLSQDIQLRKPNADIFEFVLQENKLTPETCFFIDDTKENTDAAASLGIHVWNIDETKEDVIDLFSANKILV